MRTQVFSLFFKIFFCSPAKPTPRRHTTCPSGVASRQQHCQLMRLESDGQGCGTIGPERKSPFGEPFVTNPKSLTVVCDDLDGCCSAVAKYEQGTFERVFIKLLTAQAGQAVNAFAEISRLDNHQNPHMCSELNHLSPLPTALPLAAGKFVFNRFFAICRPHLILF